MLLPLAAVLVAPALAAQTAETTRDRIRPWPQDPRYWEYGGQPALLLGGSKDDNIFQLPDLREHLDAVAAAGGNYVRNTMSDRPDKGFEVYPFLRLESGMYDLEQWNPEYWRRVDNLLTWSEERDIIVQIEVWDRFDYTDGKIERWGKHPYNPRNNVNYTVEESGFQPTYKKHPGKNEQPFFFTVPALRNNEVVLRYQQRQVAKLLSISLRHGNVLYCMDNETNASPEWGAHWARFIREKAKDAEVEVYITEMWDQWDPRGKEHRHTFDHPELYSFVDTSQNSHNKGQKHWDNLQWVRRYVASPPRPVNHVKIYGSDSGRYGAHRDAEERFWRNVIGGAASSRFHRPDAGIGLSPSAITHLKSVRMLQREVDLIRCEADGKSSLLFERSPNEAYLTRIDGEQYAVFFPDGGDVELDLTGYPATFDLQWLEVSKSRWCGEASFRGGRKVKLTPPGNGYWIAALKSTPR